MAGQLEKVTLGKSITNGLRKAMEADPKVVLIGEDIGKLGGVFRITEGLQKDFGEDRVIDSPLAESGIVGTAVGMALRGYRPVCEIQFDGFVYPAFDQIVSQVAKMHARALGAVKIPMVIRIPFGGGIGSPEHHSESPEAYFAHTAGLRVVACSNPEDAHWMIQQAVACDDPVIFFEPKRRYHDRAEYDTTATAAPRGLFEANVLREGTDVTLLGYGPVVKTMLESAAAAEAEGTSIEVIDLRSLSPLPIDDDRGVGAQDRPARRRPGGEQLPRHGVRDRRAGHRAVLLRARGTRHPGRRREHPLSAEPDGGGVPPRPRPHPRRRRPRARVLRRAATHGNQDVQPARPR